MAYPWQRNIPECGWGINTLPAIFFNKGVFSLCPTAVIKYVEKAKAASDISYLSNTCRFSAPPLATEIISVLPFRLSCLILQTISPITPFIFFAK
jgi:hypothetical protein